MEKYQGLWREIGRLWKLRKVQVVPVNLVALGSLINDFGRSIENLGISGDVGVIQETAWLGTSRILRKVLEM